MKEVFTISLFASFFVTETLHLEVARSGAPSSGSLAGLIQVRDGALATGNETQQAASNESEVSSDEPSEERTFFRAPYNIYLTGMAGLVPVFWSLPVKPDPSLPQLTTFEQALKGELGPYNITGEKLGNATIDPLLSSRYRKVYSCPVNLTCPDFPGYVRYGATGVWGRWYFHDGPYLCDPDVLAFEKYDRHDDLADHEPYCQGIIRMGGLCGAAGIYYGLAGRVFLVMVMYLVAMWYAKKRLPSIPSEHSNISTDYGGSIQLTGNVGPSLVLLLIMMAQHPEIVSANRGEKDDSISIIAFMTVWTFTLTIAARISEDLRRRANMTEIFDQLDEDCGGHIQRDEFNTNIRPVAAKHRMGILKAFVPIGLFAQGMFAIFVGACFIQVFDGALRALTQANMLAEMSAVLMGSVVGSNIGAKCGFWLAGTDVILRSVLAMFHASRVAPVRCRVLHLTCQSMNIAPMLAVLMMAVQAAAATTLTEIPMFLSIMMVGSTVSMLLQPLFTLVLPFIIGADLRPSRHRGFIEFDLVLLQDQTWKVVVRAVVSFLRWFSLAIVLQGAWFFFAYLISVTPCSGCKLMLLPPSKTVALVVASYFIALVMVWIVDVKRTDYQKDVVSESQSSRVQIDWSAINLAYRVTDWIPLVVVVLLVVHLFHPFIHFSLFDPRALIMSFVHALCQGVSVGLLTPFIFILAGYMFYCDISREVGTAERLHEIYNAANAYLWWMPIFVVVSLAFVLLSYEEPQEINLL